MTATKEVAIHTDEDGMLRNSETIPDTGILHASTTPCYIHAATSENTRIAYQADIRHFVRWGGFLPAIPGLGASKEARRQID